MVVGCHGESETLGGLGCNGNVPQVDAPRPGIDKNHQATNAMIPYCTDIGYGTQSVVATCET